jgi:hypothetical protein
LLSLSVLSGLRRVVRVDGERERLFLFAPLAR